MLDNSFVSSQITTPFVPIHVTSSSNKLYILNTNGSSYALSTNNGISFITIALPVPMNYITTIYTYVGNLILH